MALHFGRDFQEAQQTRRAEIAYRRKNAQERDDGRKQGIMKDFADRGAVLFARMVCDQHIHPLKDGNHENDNDHKHLPCYADGSIGSVIGRFYESADEDMINKSMGTIDEVECDEGPCENPDGTESGSGYNSWIKGLQEISFLFSNHGLEVLAGIRMQDKGLCIWLYHDVNTDAKPN